MLEDDDWLVSCDCLHCATQNLTLCALDVDLDECRRVFEWDRRVEILDAHRWPRCWYLLS